MLEAPLWPNKGIIMGLVWKRRVERGRICTEDASKEEDKESKDSNDVRSTQSETVSEQRDNNIGV